MGCEGEDRDGEGGEEQWKGGGGSWINSGRRDGYGKRGGKNDNLSDRAHANAWG